MMPELPEVETIRRGVAKWLVGQTVESATVEIPQILKEPVNNPVDFARKLIGSELTNARRRGKHLIFGLSNGYALYAHLNMRGQIVVAQNFTAAHDKYLCATVRFKTGAEFRYHDQWRWGELRLLHDSQEEIFNVVPALANMGDEPLSDSFDGASLAMKASSRAGSPIKSVLLDQAVVAGVGNIYADESLHRAGIAPLRKTCTLTENEWRTLAAEIKSVLNEAIIAGGTESDHYVDVDGKIGRYHPRVYGRAKENCMNCATQLMKVKLGGRSSVYCPYCQH